MKRSTLYITFAALGVGAIIAALFFVPVASKSIGCGQDQRFSIIQGQTAEYNAIEPREQAINEGVCASYGSYELFLF